jgi:hypothetical protein
MPPPKSTVPVVIAAPSVTVSALEREFSKTGGSRGG